MRFALICKRCGKFFGWHPTEPRPVCECGSIEFEDDGTV